MMAIEGAMRTGYIYDVTFDNGDEQAKIPAPYLCILGKPLNLCGKGKYHIVFDKFIWFNLDKATLDECFVRLPPDYTRKDLFVLALKHGVKIKV